MSRNNGHIVKSGTGGEGGLRALDNRRSSLALLQSTVEKSAAIANTEIAKIVAFAVGIRDDPSASHRDRMRASELLTALISKGIDVAMYLDKNDRLDEGKPTEIVEERVFEVDFDRRG